MKMEEICRLWISSTLAGCAIALGAAANIACNHKIVGAIFFSIGLITICSFQWHLFTGKVPYAHRFDWLNLIIIWVGNGVGALLIGYVLANARLSSGMVESATALIQTKISTSYFEMFVSGGCCNVLIYLAVEGFKEIKDNVGKYLLVFLGVSVFVICGFEHCIADIAYYGMTKLPLIEVIPLIVFATLGNAVGGLLIGRYHSLIKEK